MKLVLIGDLSLGPATLFTSRPDVHTGKVGDVGGALALLDANEPMIAALRLSSIGTGASEAIADLSAAGVSVLALASEATATLRAAGFEAGAADVLFPPITAERIESAVLSLLGRPARRESRFSSDAKVMLAVGKQTLQGQLLDLSVGGLRAKISGALPVGGVARVAMQLPAPHRMPVLFARILAVEPLQGDESVGFNQLRARFVGETDDERTLLRQYLQTLNPEPVAPAIALKAIQAMDPQVLLECEGAALAGVRAPALTSTERKALAERGATLPPAAGVALARARAMMLASLLEANAAAFKADPSALELDAVRAEVKVAREAARSWVSETMGKQATPAALRETRDVQARLDAASDSLERVIAAFEGRQIERKPVAALDAAPLLEQAARPVASEKKAERKDASASGKIVRTLPDPEAPKRRRARMAAFGAIVLLGGSATTALWVERHQRWGIYDAAATVVEQPARKYGSIDVAQVFPQNGHVIVVVDGTWYAATHGEKRNALDELNRDVNGGRAPSSRSEIDVRDLFGKAVARIDVDGAVHLALSAPPGATVR